MWGARVRGLRPPSLLASYIRSQEFMATQYLYTYEKWDLYCFELILQLYLLHSHFDIPPRSRTVIM